MWYKDNGTRIIMVNAEEACNQPKAYFFIYKKYEYRPNTMADLPEICDLFIDSYATTNDKQVAVSLHLPIDKNRRGECTPLCRNIISDYENSDCQNLKEFKMFINNNKLNVHIWRYHKKSDRLDHVPMFMSCVNNGTSGFQLDYLLRERKAYDTETILIKKR